MSVAEVVDQNFPRTTVPLKSNIDTQHFATKILKPEIHFSNRPIIFGIYSSNFRGVGGCFFVFDLIFEQDYLVGVLFLRWVDNVC